MTDDVSEFAGRMSARVRAALGDAYDPADGEQLEVALTKARTQGPLTATHAAVVVRVLNQLRETGAEHVSKAEFTGLVADLNDVLVSSARPLTPRVQPAAQEKRARGGLFQRRRPEAASQPAALTKEEADARHADAVHERERLERERQERTAQLDAPRPTQDRKFADRARRQAELEQEQAERLKREAAQSPAAREHAVRLKAEQDRRERDAAIEAGRATAEEIRRWIERSKQEQRLYVVPSASWQAAVDHTTRLRAALAQIEG